MANQEISSGGRRRLAGRHTPPIFDPILASVMAMGCCLVAAQIFMVMIVIFPGINKISSMKIAKFFVIAIVISSFAMIHFAKKTISDRPLSLYLYGLLWPPVYATWSLAREFNIAHDGVFKMPSYMPPGMLALVISFMAMCSVEGYDRMGRSALSMRARAIDTSFRAFFISNSLAFIGAFFDPSDAVYFFVAALIFSITLSTYQLGYLLLAEAVGSRDSKRA